MSSSAVCTVPVDFVDDFDAPSFENTNTIEWMHEVPPRYGRSRDILSLMQGTEDEQREYLRGLLASAITIFCFFLLWMFLLIVFKSMGPSKAGILSGTVPSNSSGENGKNGTSKGYRHMNLLRAVVCFSGLSIVICCILMSVNGADSLSQGVDEGRNAIGIVQNLTEGGINIIETVIEQNKEGSDVVQRFLDVTNSFCPTVRNPICTDTNNFTTCDFTGIFDNEELEAVLEHFAAGERSVLYEELARAKNNLEDFHDYTYGLDSKAQSFHAVVRVAVVFSWMLAVVCIAIMVGVVLRLPKLLTCLRHIIVIPSFSILVFCSFVFSMLFIIGSMALADLCIDSPDPRILVILDRFKDQLSPIMVEFASFYVNQCPQDAIPKELEEQLLFVTDAVPKISDFAVLVSESRESFEAICGTTDTQDLVDVAAETNEQLCDIGTIMRTVRLYFQCENWYPLYETTVYDAMCYSGTDGFGWIATTQFVIVFMAMVILTFRVAFQHHDDQGDDASEKTQDSPKSSTLRPSPSHKYYGKTPVLTASADDDGFEMAHSF